MTAQTLSGEALGGLTAGTLATHGIHINGDIGISGTDTPGRRTKLQNRQTGDGAHGGSQTFGTREIAAVLGIDSFETLSLLESAMDVRPDPGDEVPLLLTGLGFDGVRRAYVRPERFAYKVNNLATFTGYWRVDASWVSTDGRLYAEDQVEHIFGTGSATDGMSTSPDDVFSFDITNEGTKGRRSGRAMELRITAHGTVVDPYIKIADDADRAGEIVTWHRTMTSGQVILTDHELSARIGSLQINGSGRSGASKYLSFPKFMPGTQTIEVGCASGTISGYLKTRGIW